jgi:hypothetical protein
MQTEAKRVLASSSGWLEMDNKNLDCGGIPQAAKQ